VLGEEGPVTLRDCQLNSGVRLSGGFFAGSVFLSQVQIGSCAHVRPACLLEEGVSIGHSVGLKQTILFPFVTLGSLINFCDCLMSSGTSRSNHAEVGSSYTHFNFTPYQDKATPSLVGDVPRGVFLNQPPIFLGGQGGMAGPCHVTFGTIVAAGSILRRDIEKPGKLIFDAGPHKPLSIDFDPGRRRDLDRVIRNNILYIGNIRALIAWYETIRAPFLKRNVFETACLNGARQSLRAVLRERIERIDQLADRLREISKSASGRKKHADTIATSREFLRRWPDTGDRLIEHFSSTEKGPAFMKLQHAMRKEAQSGSTYLDAIRSLPQSARLAGTSWLDKIVRKTLSLW
jgi:hypothetical protein